MGVCGCFSKDEQKKEASLFKMLIENTNSHAIILMVI